MGPKDPQGDIFVLTRGKWSLPCISLGILCKIGEVLRSRDSKAETNFAKRKVRKESGLLKIVWKKKHAGSELGLQ